MAVVGQTAGGGSWAKVRLTRGQSSGGVWEIDQQYPQARLAIGSDPSAGWAVQSPGVRPLHFELYWDGRCLFVADTQRAGGVTLNGMVVGGDWLQVRGRGEVTFGQATMAIETSDGAASAMPDPASARRISAAEGPSKQHNLLELTGEATRMTDSPYDGPPSLTGEATRIQDSPLDAALAPPQLGGGRPPPPPPPGGPARPRLGGEPQPPAAGQAKTLMHDELAGAVGEATRMVAMPDTPGPGYGPPAPMGGMPPPMMAPAAPLADPTGPPAAPPFGAPGAPPATGGFAPPPEYGEGGPPKKGGATPFGLPPRTLALAGALILGLVVIGFVGFGDDEEGYEEYVDPATVPATAVAPATTTTAPATTAVAPPPTVPTTTSQIAPLGSGVPPTVIPPIPTALPPAPTALAPVTTVVPIPPPTTTVLAPPTSDVVVPTGPTPERVAADQVLAGRYDQALPLYQALAAAHPERPEYSAMVQILQGRLRAQCVNGIGPDGRPCAVP